MRFYSGIKKVFCVQRKDEIVKKLMLPAMAIIVFGLFFASCTQQGRTLIPAYNNPVEEISVEAGEEFVIQLSYDPDAGYFWYEEYDSTKLQLVESTCAFCRVGEEEFILRQSYGLSGSEIPVAAQYSRFRALSPGETMINMGYKSSPTADAVEEQIFTIIIE